jgi:hypothetical protein
MGPSREQWRGCSKWRGVSGSGMAGQVYASSPRGSRLERLRGAAAPHAHAQALALRQEYVESLIAFGCVYVADAARPVAGEPSGRGGRGELQTEREFQQWRREIAPRRLVQDSVLPVGAYVRVQVHPKRFPRAWSVDWKVREGGAGAGPLNAFEGGGV